MGTAIQATAPRSWRARLLRLPIFYKVLIGNSIIVVAGAVIGTSLTLKTAGGTSRIYEMVATFAVAGTLVSVAVNWIVLRAALRPLAALERTVDQVRRGNFSVRAARETVADSEMEALTDTFNGMLDAVEAYRAQLHKLSVQVVAAQEDERKRISRELHDDTAQVLTAQLLRLKAIEATGGVDPVVLAQMIEFTAQALEGVRHMAYELRPPSLDDLGLAASLEGLAAQYRQRFGLIVRFVAERSRRRLPPDVELAVYRVVQEALTNVAKHARTESATMRLCVEDQALIASVHDDGIGFEPGAVPPSSGRGLGLFGMRERAALIDGTLTLRSGPGEGTTVELCVPLPRGCPECNTLNVAAP